VARINGPSIARLADWRATAAFYGKASAVFWVAPSEGSQNCLARCWSRLERKIMQAPGAPEPSVAAGVIFSSKARLQIGATHDPHRRPHRLSRRRPAASRIAIRLA
jgi:hypothetical protein